MEEEQEENEEESTVDGEGESAKGREGGKF